MSKPIEVTDKTFEEAVLKAELPTVVDFWAVWCGPCKMIAPMLEEIAEEYSEKLRVAKLDVDGNKEIAFKFDVMAIPTLVLFKEGQEVDRIVGKLPKQELVARLEPHL